MVFLRVPTNKMRDNKLMLCNNNILPTLKGNNCHFFCIITKIKKEKSVFCGCSHIVRLWYQLPIQCIVALNIQKPLLTHQISQSPYRKLMLVSLSKGYIANLNLSMSIHHIVVANFTSVNVVILSPR